MTMMAPQQELVQLQQEIDRYLVQIFEQKKSEFSYQGQFEFFYDAMKEFVTRKGKRVRPLLLLSFYNAFDGEKGLSKEQLLRCGAALELLHSFILIQDDVIDKSHLRRGLPTFHKILETCPRYKIDPKISEDISMVVGDLLFALSMETIIDSNIAPELKEQVLKVFLQYTRDTGVGEIQDILLSTSTLDDIKLQEIETMYHLKTTRYTFEAPFVLGTLLAGVNGTKLSAIRELAQPLGLAFQIRNDLLEIDQFIKDPLSFSSDLAQGKKTYLLKTAYDLLNVTDRNFLKMCLVNQPNDPAVNLKLIQLIQKSGAVAHLEKKSADLFTQSLAVLENNDFSWNEQQALKKVIEGIGQQIGITFVQAA
jgi:geranylgeranyl diphosphate synthase type I